MSGGIRVTVQNNIFNLIRNPAATADDLRKLIGLAPSRLTGIENGLNPLDLALSLNKEDMVKVLEEYGLTKTDIEKQALYEFLITNPPIEEFQTRIAGKDLSFLSEAQQSKVLLKAIATSSSDILCKKLELLINANLNPNASFYHKEDTLLVYLINMREAKSTDLIQLLLDKGANPNIQTKFGPPLLYAITNSRLQAMKNLIEKGADVNYLIEGKKSYFGLLRQTRTSLEYYKVLLDGGLNPDAPIDDEETTMLYSAILSNNSELFYLFIEKGANVNYKRHSDGFTPLMVTSVDGDIDFVIELIEKGADVNAVDNLNYTALIHMVNRANSDDYFECIEYLVYIAGADKTIKVKNVNYTAADVARYHMPRNPELYKKILKVLGEEYKEEKWKGSTRSDIEKYDIFFEKPYDWSCCPICLEYVERSEGCMYMSHDCSIRKHFYHKELYNIFVYQKFVGAPNRIEWCTICGRPTKEHKHYILSSANAPSKELARIKPEIQERLNRGDNQAFFDNANCIGFGGGGTEEKASRFRRLREYALELQDDIGKRSHDDVMKELIEEVFNAPLVRSRKIKTILEDKKWDIPIGEFPADTVVVEQIANPTAPDVAFTGTLPTKLDPKDHDCVIMADENEGNEENPTYQFHHERVGGIDHTGIYICQKDLSRAIEIATKEFGDVRFGKCWFSQCQGTMHPEEIKGIVPDVLYQDYKQKFNRKMAGGRRRATRRWKVYRGGDESYSVLHPVDTSNTQCDPAKKGAKRTPKNKRRRGTYRKRHQVKNRG